MKCGKSAEGPFEERRVVLGCADKKRVAVKDGLQDGDYVRLTGKATK